jgi:hypothetical protein
VTGSFLVAEAAHAREGVRRVRLPGVLVIIVMAWSAASGSALAATRSAPSLDISSTGTAPPHAAHPAKALMIMSENDTSTSGAAEMKAAQALTTKVLAIGSWTAKATPETRPAIMPSEARDTMRLQLAGKIDQWFAKTDGSGAVFLMNVTDPAEAHALLEKLPLGQAGMMTFELIPVGPLWPLGLLLREPGK